MTGHALGGGFEDGLEGPALILVAVLQDLLLFDFLGVGPGVTELVTRCTSWS
jgi:hypothetical protein